MTYLSWQPNFRCTLLAPRSFLQDTLLCPYYGFSPRVPLCLCREGRRFCLSWSCFAQTARSSEHAFVQAHGIVPSQYGAVTGTQCYHVFIGCVFLRYFSFVRIRAILNISSSRGIRHLFCYSSEQPVRILRSVKIVFIH